MSRDSYILKMLKESLNKCPTHDAGGWLTEIADWELKWDSMHQPAALNEWPVEHPMFSALGGWSKD